MADNQSRRRFLQTLGTSGPTLAMMAQAAAAQQADSDEIAANATPIDLSGYFTASAVDFGTRARARDLGGESARDGLIRTLAGKRDLRGLPFWLAPENVAEKSWIVLSTQPESWSLTHVDIPLGWEAHFVCLASFCDWDPNEALGSGDVLDAFEKVGQQLADAILVYDDGGQAVIPLRRRFETASLTYRFGQAAFAAQPHYKPVPRKLTEPLSNAMQWGNLQDSDSDRPMQEPPGTLWICALANPDPRRRLKFLRLEARARDPLAVCGITLFHGAENPLRWERLSLFRLTLPARAEERGRWNVSVDLGVVARTFTSEFFSPEQWLASPAAGLGEPSKPAVGSQYLYAEITANSGATLTLRDSRTGSRYQFDLSQTTPGKEVEAKPVGARVQMLERESVWLHGQVLDSSTGRPTPVRLAFRSKEGRYIPPYGHRTDINDGWFQDYGADVKLMDTSFAYVDGTFQIELPVGEVFVEMTKGFEYNAQRQRLNIQPDQRELKLEISRYRDLRSQGWVSADVHVHFLSPTTAVLEGQAEGLNMIHLLASQWGDLFTNVGDSSYGPLTSHDRETIVWVGSENRQHILGHLNALGADRPIYPMAAAGPQESYIGDPLWASMADWADECRRAGGLAVAAHIPYPTAELAADIVLGKYDAVEVWPQFDFNNLRYLDWYRYLNCGYRLPAVGGTDKMGAYMPVGTNRVYAFLGQDELSFANWAAAVRRGNTFISSGPLLLFQADGRHPGEEITMRVGGGEVELRVEATCFVPIHRLEVVWNGLVVASTEERAGTRAMSLHETVHVSGPGWFAARCSSQMGPVTSWGFRIAAHTSPVYVRVAGQDLFSAPAATYFLNLIEGSQMFVENLATRPDRERFERIRKVFRDASDELHRRLHEHGIAH